MPLQVMVKLAALLEFIEREVSKVTSIRSIRPLLFRSRVTAEMMPTVLLD